jgi:hypothetical protein
MHHNEGGEMGSAMGSRRDRRMKSNGAQYNGTTDLKETQVSRCSPHVMLFTTTTQLISLVCFRNSSLSVLTTYDAFHHNHPIDLFLPPIPDLEQFKFLKYKRLQKSLRKDKI